MAIDLKTEDGGVLREGEMCHDFFMKTIDDKVLETADYRGKKLWLAFYRYAGCPMCATHLAQVLEAKNLFSETNIHMIAIYDCDPANIPVWIRKNATARLQVVADKTQALHAKFGAQKSYSKLFSAGSAMAWAKASAEGQFVQKLDGSLNMMPAHILVDENGRVEKAYYAQHAGDHIPWKTVREFSTAAVRQPLPVETNPSISVEIEGAPTLKEIENAIEVTVKTELTVLPLNDRTRAFMPPKDFAVNYKWKLRLGHEEAFLQTWKSLEEQTKMRHNEYLGARLYLDSEQYVAAFTMWSNKAAWEQYWITKEQTLPDFLKLSACVERTFDAQICRSIFDSTADAPIENVKRVGNQ